MKLMLYICVRYSRGCSLLSSSHLKIEIMGMSKTKKRKRRAKQIKRMLDDYKRRMKNPKLKKQGEYPDYTSRSVIVIYTPVNGKV